MIIDKQRAEEIASKYCIDHGIERLIPSMTNLIVLSSFHANALKIYNSLEYYYKSTGDIALELGLKSNDVASILTKLYKHTNLICMMRDGKLKSWAKS